MKTIASLGFMFLLIYLLSIAMSDIGKYNGYTAEELADRADYWEDKYVNLKECVEDYDMDPIEEKITRNDSFHYCSSNVLNP